MPRRRNHAARYTVAFLCLLASLLASHAVANAQPAEVVVLPMTSTARSLRIYRNAAPSALASQLSQRMGVTARAVSSASDVPKNSKIIIDGRLVRRGEEQVQIEVRVRRASTGRPVATVASGVAQTTDIDRLVGQLATSLGPVLHRALEAEPYTLPTTVVRGQGLPTVHGQDPTPANERAQLLPPDVLLLPASGQAAQGVVGVRIPATQAAAHMLERLGLRVGQSEQHEGIANAVEVVREMRARSTRYSLMVQVLSVNFSYESVLSARGRVRVILIGEDGLAILDKRVSTNTVVGGRGDRHQALVYRVVEQALDMLYPHIRSALSPPGASLRSGV